MFSAEWFRVAARFLTCRGRRLDGDGCRFDHRHYGCLHWLDDDGFGLQGRCSLSEGKRCDEWFRLNGDFRAQVNGPQHRFSYKQKKSTILHNTNTINGLKMSLQTSKTARSQTVGNTIVCNRYNYYGSFHWKWLKYYTRSLMSRCWK